jgi:GntR family transcriptional regulator, arabinose operon transcriptional repressor
MPRSDSAYRAIYTDLKGRIHSGEYATDQKLPTEAEIAATFGVSRVTSRKALELLERDGLIYRKQGAGSFVADRSSRLNDAQLHNRIISMLIPFSTRQGRAVDMIRGAGDYLAAQGYYLNIQICEHNLERERDMLKSALRAPVSGILFYPISDVANVEILYTHYLNGCRLVTLDKQISNLPIPAVVSDNRAGSYEAVRYLIAHGHTRIGYVSDIGMNEAVSVRDRYLGYCKALHDAGIAQRDSEVSMINTETAVKTFPEFFRTPDADPSDSTLFSDFYTRILSRFLDSPEPVTAICTVNDYVAVHILSAARSLGVKVPESLSVIGFDDIELAAQLDPPLTTVRQDFYAMGYEGARLVVEKGSPTNAALLTIPTKLIERKSVAQSD